MLGNRKIMLILLVLFFAIGFLLSFTRNQERNICDQQKEPYDTPLDEKYDSTNNHENMYVASANEGRENNHLNQEYEDIDGNKNQNYSPDIQYFKLAEVLQKQFPDTFIMNYKTDKKRVALTFDDGPDSKTTPEILNILSQNSVSATFFVVGKNLNQFPGILKRMVDEGHQIANHSWSHLRPTELADRDLLLEIGPTNEALQTHDRFSEPFYYRPPYGLLNPTQIEQIRQQGYVVISWSIDSLDWATSNPEEIKNKVITSIHPGAIILMHSAGGKDGRSGTIKALPEIIDNLTRQGYEFVTVKDLLGSR